MREHVGPTLDTLPAADCDFHDLLYFGSTDYDGYDRIADSPEALYGLYQPIREEWERSGQLPYWMGLDLLRGLLFLMAREDHMAGPIFLEPTDTPGQLNMGNLPDDLQAGYERPFRQVVEPSGPTSLAQSARSPETSGPRRAISIRSPRIAGFSGVGGRPRPTLRPTRPAGTGRCRPGTRPGPPSCRPG